MRKLVRQLLDNQISRRGFVQEMVVLGVSLSSAQALVNSIADASAAETGEVEPAREVTGNGADLLMESLLEADVKYIFHGNGGGTIRFFNSIVTRPQLTNFLATNEGQAVAMAEGYHIASGGELGVAIIPKPGLGNATGNIYNALANRSSLLILTARESGEFSDRDGDLELVDWHEVMDPLMKWSYRMYHLERIPEFTRRAIKVAHTPPGGPTFLQFNEDLYEQEGTGKIIPQTKFHVAAKIKPKPEDIENVAELLLESESPLVTVGFEVTKAQANAEIIELAELLALPVTQGLSGFADFPNQHPLFLGNYTPYRPQARAADLYLSIGSPMPDESSTVHAGPAPENAKTVHISLEPDTLAISWPTDLSIVADVGEAISDLLEAIKSRATEQRLASIREERYEKIQAYTSTQRAKRVAMVERAWDQAPMKVARISIELDALLDEDAIIVKEATPIGAPEWFDFGPGKKTLIGGLGTTVLGWATGAALGAKLAKPDSQVVAISGDGAFMFQHALWSLSRHDAAIIVVIYNNRDYNTSRAFQWRGAQARLKKDIVNYLGDPDVDFSLIARAYGVDSEVVATPSELRPAIQRAIAATNDGKPYLLDVLSERWGPGSELTWHPDTSIAKMRKELT